MNKSFKFLPVIIALSIFSGLLFYNKIVFADTQSVTDKEENQKEEKEPQLSPEDRERFYRENNIIFYNPNTCDTDTGSAMNFGDWSDPLPAKFDEKFGNRIKSQVEKYKHVYMNAEKVTKLPWQLLAAIHYNENTGLYDPNCGGYPCSIANGRDQVNGKRHQSETNSDVGATIEEDAIIGAEHVKEMFSGKLGISLDDPKYTRDIKALAVAAQAYNAGSYCNESGYSNSEDISGKNIFGAIRRKQFSFEDGFKYIYLSPYVLNFTNDKLAGMKWDGCENQGVPKGVVGSNPGVVAIMKFLDFKFSGGSTGGSCSPSGTATSGSPAKLLEVYNKYAWSEYCKGYNTDNCKYFTPKNPDSVWNNHYSSFPWDKTDCGGWVSFSMRTSGYDKQFNKDRYLCTAMYNNYFGKTGETKNGWKTIYEGVCKNYDKALLQPGDAAYNPEHTWYYVGNNIFSSASLGQRVPMKGFPCETAYVKWVRRVGGSEQ